MPQAQIDLDVQVRGLGRIGKPLAQRDESMPKGVNRT
jgi:hypothetical protein